MLSNSEVEVVLLLNSSGHAPFTLARASSNFWLDKVILAIFCLKLSYKASWSSFASIMPNALYSSITLCFSFASFKAWLYSFCLDTISGFAVTISCFVIKSLIFERNSH